MTAPRTPAFFITGTDTGVGKTLVTAALMTALQTRGLRCLVAKPIQTGCADGADDLAWCRQWSVPPTEPALASITSLYRLPLPASPDLAARHAGVSIDLTRIADAMTEARTQTDILLIEGAGGLLAPVTRTATMLDLMTACHARPVVVTRASLGTLNHTALTLRELARHDITPAALVVNETEPAGNADETLIQNDNVECILRLAQPAPVCRIGFLASVTRETLARAGRELAAHLVPG